MLVAYSDNEESEKEEESVIKQVDSPTELGDENESAAQKIRLVEDELRDAILPPLIPELPDWNIPPSPPIPDNAEQLPITATVDKYLALKAQGKHFNQTLADNPAFRNPSMINRLREFVGIEDEYGSNMPREVWSHLELPKFAYADKIAQQQRETESADAERQAGRKAVDFAPAAHKD